MHSLEFIDLVKHDRYQARLPVVTVDDIGALVGFEHEFQRSPAKKGHAHIVVPTAIEGPPVKKVIL